MTNKWKIFNKQGKYIKTVKANSYEVLKTSLKNQGLYAHRFESFQMRSEKWQKKSFKEKLETLGWEFENGLLVNTEW